MVPHPYKDILCPLPSNDVIRSVLKKGRKKNTNSSIPSQGIANPTTTSHQPTKQPARRTKLKQHETRTILVEGEKVDADPNEVASDDQDSDYVDNNFDSAQLRTLEE